MGTFLIYGQAGAVATLTMNQPETRNALTGNSAIEDFLAACARINADPSVRAVVLTGAGNVFSSGGNIKHLKQQFDEDAISIRQGYRHGIQQLTLALYNLEVPTIAAINGPAIGAGCDLCCMCDIRIASDNARFAESFVCMGLIPGDGGAWLLPRVVGMSRAAELSFTGDTISAAKALAYGLVSRVVPQDQLLIEANSLALRIASNPGHVLRMTKKLLRESQHVQLGTLLEMSAGMQALAHKTKQHLEAVTIFHERRPAKDGDN